MERQISYSKEFPLGQNMFRVSGDFSGCAICDVGEISSVERCLLLFKFMDDTVMFYYADFLTFLAISIKNKFQTGSPKVSREFCVLIRGRVASCIGDCDFLSGRIFGYF
jgi:hypothetical protein